jgi:hypothetical protein
MMFALWAVSTWLELLGAFLSLKRRNWMLFSLLLFAAESDVALVPIRILASGYVYGICFFAAFAVKYALMCLLAITICGHLVSAEKSMHTRMYAAIFTLASAGVVVRVFSDGATWTDRFKDAENAANIIILVVLCVAWISRSKSLQAPWSMVTAGLLVMVLSDFGITLLCNWFQSAWKLYPLGAIPAYAIWCWAMRKGYPAGNEIPMLVRGKMYVRDFINEMVQQ